MRPPTRAVLAAGGLALLCAVAGAPGCGDAPMPMAHLVDSRSGKELARFDIRWARTAAERQAGLAKWPPLHSHQALLLEFPLEGEVCITNAPVDYAIDMAFFGDASTLLTARCGVSAHDARSYCVRGVRRVLETRSRPDCPWPVGTWLGLSGE